MADSQCVFCISKNLKPGFDLLLSHYFGSVSHSGRRFSGLYFTTVASVRLSKKPHRRFSCCYAARLELGEERLSKFAELGRLILVYLTGNWQLATGNW